ncbi:MAG TPA: hypothetical protein VHU41_06760 [Thermoanaerobaculia bacterium]|nr:hypothetical protein [Thermoanaerobaculia bacterium]
MLLMSVAAVRAECPDLTRLGSNASAAFVGRFYDSYWALSFQIPSGLTAYSDKAPNPMHGIVIPLPWSPPSAIYVFAYDKPRAASMKTVESDQMEVLRSGGSIASISSRHSSRIDSRIAAEYDVAYACGGDDPLMEQFFLVENPGHGIFYRIGLYSHRSRWKSDQTVFRKIIATCHIHAAPVS